MSRECGTCSMCCKLPLIHEPSIAKPAHKWCRHCDVGKGCGIYEVRPKVCQDFACIWLLREEMPDDMRPDKCGAMFTTPLNDDAIHCTVDLNRRQVYRSGRVKEWLDKFAKRLVVKVIGEQLPNSDESRVLYLAGPKHLVEKHLPEGMKSK